MSDAHAAEIVAFWRDAGASRWFNGGPAFDAECRERFKAAHLSASRGEMAGWMGEADSALALLQAESDEQVQLMGKPNQLEAVRANLEKRAPVFSTSQA